MPPTVCKFPMGSIRATPAALEVIEDAGQEPLYFLERHAQGDWGDVEPGDWLANDRGLQNGGRLLSSYRTLKGEKLWIITEATSDHGKRESTCILLPDEY